ncbi:MAG: hypothetical protein LLG40_05695 [Deltaproteobacteria bacterium]|nr:hypothetical protein [Deltaproteobacteria bacterium]
MKPRHLLVLLWLAGVIATGCSGGGSDANVETTQPGDEFPTLNTESQVCAGCHSKNVAAVYLDATETPVAGSPTIIQEYARSVHNTEVFATCAQCHKPATGHPNPTTADVNPDATGTCLDCHSFLALPHLQDNPATFDALAPAQFVDLALTGYDTGAKGGCRSCHNPHDTTSRIALFKDYVNSSGHGDTQGEAWIHYRWKGTNRTACQRCHTTSGFISQVTGGTGIVAFDTADNTKQTLYCNGCHENYSYKVRSASAVNAVYQSGTSTDPIYGTFSDASDPNPVIDPVTGSQTAANTFPNIGKSNLCLNCHSARTIGDNIKKTAINAAYDFKNLGFINSHYLTGGAIVYAVGGYEFAGQTYANPSYYAHNQIGTSLQPATGTGGPCVGCHMTPARHTFKGWTKDSATEKLTAIVSRACITCHSEITAEGMNEENERFQAALAALEAQLGMTGFYFSPNNPYFFTAPYDPTYIEPTDACPTNNLAVLNWQTGGTVVRTWNTTTKKCVISVGVSGTDGTGEKNMGAAYNLNLLIHDPGAYTHNRLYAKRLIWDSIDWADDETMNNSVIATLDALVTAGKLTSAQRDSVVAYYTPSSGPPPARP